MTDRTFDASSHDTVRDLVIGDEIAQAEHDRLELRFRFLKQIVGARKSGLDAG